MRAGAADYRSRGNLAIEAVTAESRHAVALQAEERQRHAAEAALRSSEGRFRALVENSSDVLVLVDGQGRVVYVTPSAARHLAWSPVDLIDRSLLDLIHTDDRELTSMTIGEVLREPGEPIPVEVRVQHGDGSWRSMEGIAVN